MEEAELAGLIALGEGPNLEFESTLRYDLKTGSTNRDLTKVVAKTIAGFLNAQGGTLLIGVADDGTLLGVENDLAILSRQTTDYFENTLRNALGKYLGVHISSVVTVDFATANSVQVAVVSCDRHLSPVCIRDNGKLEFYVRDGNSTKPLDVRAAHEYIAGHFPYEGPGPRPFDGGRCLGSRNSRDATTRSG